MSAVGRPEASGREPHLRVLLAMRNLMYLRNYASTIRDLAERGHEVTIACETEHGKITSDIREAADELVGAFDRIRIRNMPGRRGFWRSFAAQLRIMRDFARYQDPRLAVARKCAQRAESQLYPPLRNLVLGPADAGEDARWARAQAWSGRCAAIERCLAPPKELVALVREERPDVAVVTPLVDFNTDQVDFVKAVQAEGVPAVLAVASWDNLTNKGLVPVLPDQVLVWNEAQRAEAETLHAIPADRVTVTGAQLFDQWFERKPVRDRQAFCREVGLDPDKPFILYTCSSVFIARQEAGFVARWLEALRSSEDPVLREAGVLIRPHPGSAKFAHQWDAPEIAGRDNVAVFPRQGGYPVSENAQRDYFDSLFHSHAVFGINTSALLEAGIVGRRVFTVLDQEFADTQEGMVHFEHLTKDGFLAVAPDFESHLKQISDALSAPVGRTPDIEAFVHSFLRPNGAERRATPFVADAIEVAAARKRAPERRPANAALVMAAMALPALWMAFADSRRTTKKWGPKNRLIERLKTAIALRLGWIER